MRFLVGISYLNMKTMLVAELIGLIGEFIGTNGSEPREQI